MDTTTTPNTNLTVQDLVGLKSCIEVACSRGAYRAEEMKSVGEVFDRISAFLKAIEEQAQQVQDGTQTEATTEPQPADQGE